MGSHTYGHACQTYSGYISDIIYYSPPLPSPPLPSPTYVQLGRTMINSGSNVFAAGLKSVYCISLQPKSRVVSGSRVQFALHTHTHSHALQHTFLPLLPCFAPTNPCWYVSPFSFHSLAPFPPLPLPLPSASASAPSPPPLYPFPPPLYPFPPPLLPSPSLPIPSPSRSIT